MKDENYNPEEVIVLREYPTVEAAMSDLNILQQEGINAQLMGESVNSIMPLLTFADVRLCVLAKDVELAEKILETVVE